MGLYEARWWKIHNKMSFIVKYDVHSHTTGKSYFAEHRTLCRESWKRHSTKTTFCREPRQTAKTSLRVPKSDGRQRRALGKVPIHLTPVAAISPLPRSFRLALGKGTFFCGTWQAFLFFFVFWAEFFMLYVTIWNSILKFGVILNFFLLYLPFLFFFVFFRIIQIWTAGTWNIASHRIRCILSPYPGPHMKSWPSHWGNMSSYVREKWIKII